MLLFGIKSRQHRGLWIRISSVMIFACVMLLSSTVVWGNPSDVARVAAYTSFESTGSNSSPKELNRFLKASEGLYEAVNKGKLEEALTGLFDVEQAFRSLPMNSITSVEGIQALAHNITELKRAAASVSPDQDKWRKSAAALRLSADALSHPASPIWHQYRTILIENVYRMKTVLGKKDTDTNAVVKEALEEFNLMTQHYYVIRTAALLQSEPWKIERSDSVVRYVSRVLSATPPNPLLWPSIIPQLEEAMEGLFPPNKSAESALVPPVAAPPWGWSAMMGSFIVTILTWVGWRRYRADPYIPAGKSAKSEEPHDAAERLLNIWRK